MKNVFKQKIKEGKYPILISLFVFLPLCSIDILLSLNNGLFYDAVIIGFTTVLNILLAISMYFNRKNYYLIPLNCYIFITAISVLVIRNGITTGSYFYYLPAVIIYIIFAIDIRHKINFKVYFLIIFSFVGIIVFSFVYTHKAGAYPLYTVLFIYRLNISLVISAIVLRYMLPIIINKENLKVRKNYHKTLFQSPLDAYIIIHKETRLIVDYNKTTSLLFKLPYEVSLNGLYVSQLMTRYLASDSVNTEILMNDIPDNWLGEGNFVTHEKDEFTGYVNTLTYYKNDKAYQVLCIRDITKMKQAEQTISVYKTDLENSTKVKTRFLSSMSHELRTPLNGIIGTTNLILEDASISEHVKKQLQLQLYSSEHMLGIINDILDFSKIDSGKMEFNVQPFNLLDALQHLVYSFENQFKANKIELFFDYDPRLEGILITSDETKLRQVLNNLLSNSLKFTLDGHVRLSVSIENDATDDIAVLFKVTDTGIGISKEKQVEIFEGFTQVHAEDLKRRFGGTGLGLTISQKLANMFGGTINVESDLGKGACFYVTINFKKQIIQQSIQDDSNCYHPPADIRGVRILIVEDNEVNMVILKTFLKKWGIRIMEAGNGIQALELLKYHDFDLIFMDLEMPEMNGYTATKIIRENNNPVPVIAFTATLLENMNLLITKSGFNDYILKPFKPGDLKKVIEKFVPNRKIEYA